VSAPLLCVSNRGSLIGSRPGRWAALAGLGANRAGADRAAASGEQPTTFPALALTFLDSYITAEA